MSSAERDLSLCLLVFKILFYFIYLFILFFIIIIIFFIKFNAFIAIFVHLLQPYVILDVLGNLFGLIYTNKTGDCLFVCLFVCLSVRLWTAKPLGLTS